MEKIDYILSKKTIEELVSDPIGVKPARDLAYIYLNIPPRNGGFNHHEFFGGYFNASEFELTNHVGIRLWYCMVNENAKFPKFFLALEKLTSYDDTNPEETTNMAINLNVPKSIKYNGKSPQKDDILDHLKSNLFKKISGKFRTIPKGLVLEYSTNFRNFIRKNSKDESNPIDPYSKYVVAFFFKNKAYDQFMARKPISVGYFMGYAKHRDFFPNYLRPILAGVDKQGKIILQDHKISPIPSDETLLQHSWPPPPPNTEK